MSTERQIQASRANGSKSRGPATAEGKRNSSRNATTHGMLSGTVVIKGESRDRFFALLAALVEEFQPRTPFEESLIENMAVARWHQMRLWGMEKAAMEHQMGKQAGASPSNDDAATRAALAFRSLSDDSRSLELINRYQSRCDRQYLRAHRRFLEVRDRRTPPPTPLPVATPPQPTPAAEPETPSTPEKVEPSKRTRELAANKGNLSLRHNRKRIHARAYRRIFKANKKSSGPVLIALASNPASTPRKDTALRHAR